MHHMEKGHPVPDHRDNCCGRPFCANLAHFVFNAGCTDYEDVHPLSQVLTKDQIYYSRSMFLHTVIMTRFTALDKYVVVADAALPTPLQH